MDTFEVIQKRMRPIFAFPILLIFMLILSSGMSKKVLETMDESSEQRLFDMLQRSLDHSEQAANNSSYCSISHRLHQVWKSDESADWMYIERVLRSGQEKPCRLRIYTLTESHPCNIISEVYPHPVDSICIEKGKDTSFHDRNTPEGHSVREGRDVHLIRAAAFHFLGSPKEYRCESALRGDPYTVPKVEVLPGAIHSWDQAFNKDAKQYWDAEKGPYIFKKSK